MKGKKGTQLPLNWIILGLIGIAVVVILFSLVFGKGPLGIRQMAENVITFISKQLPFLGLTEEARCENQKTGYFWCEKATKEKGEYKPECLKWGTFGKEGDSCDPDNYKPVNYERGKYDICSQECTIQYCKAGTGRIGKECKACKYPDEACGGGVFGIGSSGECCAPEFVKCEGGIIVTSGKCKPKAVIRT